MRIIQETENTKRRFVRASETERYRDSVHPAWEVYGRFGRTFGVYEKTNLGTETIDTPPSAMEPGKKWVRLIWVRYV